MKIINANLTGFGTNLTLDVTAIAPTLGYTNVSLTRVEYIVAPKDGFQDIILLATPPNGPAAASIETFVLTLTLATEDWFRGVRIRDTSNDQMWSLGNPTKGKAPIGNDFFSIGLVDIKEDKLLINLRYGGGCKPHSFQLNWDGVINESLPPQIVLDLSHDSSGDSCLALISETLQFDLSTLEGFPQQKVLIRIKNPGQTIEVTYEPVHTPSTVETTADAAILSSANLISVFPVIERGYSTRYDLGEAIREAVGKLPPRSSTIADHLASYKVINIGAEIGGFAGLNRLFVDVEG